MKLEDTCSLEEKLWPHRQHIKKQRHYFTTKVHLVKATVFPVVMYGCESWTIKKAECWRTDAFELWCWKRLESPLDCKEIQPVHPKANQSWVFIGRTDVEAETPILWPPDVKSWFIGKDPDTGKDRMQEDKGMMEDEMAGCHYWLNDMNLSKLWELAMGWTGKSGVLQFMGLQRVGHDWATELNWMVLQFSLLSSIGVWIW